MKLQDYYKKRVYQYGYDRGWLDRNKGIERPNREIKGDIFFEDEQDYYICADYYGNFVGEESAWSQEDIDFLAVLGFGTGDFEND